MTNYPPPKISPLREQAVEAFTNSVDSPRWRRQDGVNAVVDVVLAAVADEIKALPKTGEGALRPEAVLAVVERLRG